MNHLTRVQERLRTLDLPAILLTDLANISWLTGFTGTFAQVLITGDKAILISDSRYTLQAQEQVKIMPVTTFASPRKAIDILEEKIREFGITRLAFESRQVVVDTYNIWKSRLEGLELVPVADFIGPLRAVKTPEEIDRIRRACKITDDCYQHLLGFVRPGVTELEVRDEVIAFFKSRDAEPGYPPIVVSGERSARPHGIPSDKKIEEGDFVTMDIGAKVEGYTADMTRTFVVGRATDRQREVYNEVLRAQVDACMELIPGANGRDIERRVREKFERKDLNKYFGHGLGHGIGALVHDAGRLSINEDQPIEPGQVWTVEPGVYIEGFGGVRIEDDVLVTEKGPELLTHFNRELIEVGA